LGKCKALSALTSNPISTGPYLYGKECRLFLIISKEAKRFPFLWKSFWRRLFRLDFSYLAELPFSYSDKEKGQKTYWRLCYWWSLARLKKLAKKSKFEVLESGYSRDNRNNKRNIYLVLRKI